MTGVSSFPFDGNCNARASENSPSRPPTLGSGSLHTTRNATALPSCTACTLTASVLVAAGGEVTIDWASSATDPRGTSRQTDADGSALATSCSTRRTPSSSIVGAGSSSNGGAAGSGGTSLQPAAAPSSKPKARTWDEWRSVLVTALPHGVLLRMA